VGLKTEEKMNSNFSGDGCDGVVALAGMWLVHYYSVFRAQQSDGPITVQRSGLQGIIEE
jgi:hypothetical protein